MAILFASNEAVDFAGAVEGNSETGAFDSDYVDKYIEVSIPQNAASPIVISVNEDIGSNSEFWLHFDGWIAPTFSSSSDGWWFQLLDADGNEVARLEANNGYFNCRCHGADSAAEILLPDEVLQTYDFCFIDNGDGTDTFKWYQQGVLVDSKTTSRPGSREMPHRVIFGHTDILGFTNDNFARYSQVIIADESTIGMKLTLIDPASIGNYTDVSSTITEVSDLNLTTGWLSNTAGDKNSLVTDAFTPVTGEIIHSVVPTALLRSGNTGPQKLEAFLRISGTDYYFGTAKEGVDHSGNIVFDFTQNPATSAPWASSDLSSGIEIGFEFKA